MACPTRRSPAARCSPPRRRAAPSAARCRSLLAIVLKPSWSLYRGRARGRERVRPNERAILKHTTTPGIGGPPERGLASRPGVETERRCPRRTSRSSAATTRSATARPASAARSAWTTGAGSTRGLDRARTEMPVGPLFCIIDGPSRGGPWSSDAPRAQLCRLAAEASVRRRFAPHPVRRVTPSSWPTKASPSTSSRQPCHANLGTTSICLQGIENAEIIDTVHARRAPMTPATTALDR
jgi:hypothetical protein